MEDSAIYRKTERGKKEVAERSSGLDTHTRRLLIIIDGQRDLAELSVYIRAGELERTLGELLEQGLVEAVGPEDIDPDRIARAPAANDPVVFAGIKIKAMSEIRGGFRGRLSPIAEMVVEEINTCSTPLEMREKLRKLESALTQLAGAAEGVALARRIGAELTRLMPEE